MTDATQYQLTHISAAAGVLARVLARPKAVAWTCVVGLTGLGWLGFALLCVGSPLEALCGAPLEAAGVAGFVLVVAMWSAMTLAMMLPSAGPMILTYAEIAETAARKGERIVSPLMIASGYAVVWLGFAVAAATIQFSFAPIAAVSTNQLFATGLFALAGIYQFTPLKHACLTQCQRPFPFFFANWQTSARGVFGLGLKQGVYCLGCCWAMMLLMFATGAMNVLWMAVLGIVMTIEKMTNSTAFSRAVGVVLLAIAAAIVLTNPGVLR